MGHQVGKSDLPGDPNRRVVGVSASTTRSAAMYRWASFFFKSGRVLDVACGFGSGSEILRSAVDPACSLGDLLRANARSARYSFKSLLRSVRDRRNQFSFFSGTLRRPRYDLPKLEVYGVDIEIAKIRFAARRFPQVRVMTGDMCRLPFPPDTFDGVVSFESLEHVDDPEQVLGEFRRVLKPGGLFIGSIPINLPGREHKRVLQHWEVVALVESQFVNPVFLGFRQNGLMYWSGASRELLDDQSYQTKYVVTVVSKAASR